MVSKFLIKTLGKHSLYLFKPWRCEGDSLLAPPLTHFQRLQRGSSLDSWRGGNVWGRRGDGGSCPRWGGYGTLQDWKNQAGNVTRRSHQVCQEVNDATESKASCTELDKVIEELKSKPVVGRTEALIKALRITDAGAWGGAWGGGTWQQSKNSGGRATVNKVLKICCSCLLLFQMKTTPGAETVFREARGTYNERTRKCRPLSSHMLYHTPSIQPAVGLSFCML